MKGIFNYILASATSILLCAIPLFKVSFAEPVSIFEISIIVAASFLAGLRVANLTKAFITFYLSYFITINITVLAIRLPLDMYMGSLAGDLASIVVARNLAFFSFLIALPLTAMSVVLGVYVGERIRR